MHGAANVKLSHRELFKPTFYELYLSLATRPIIKYA